MNSSWLFRYYGLEGNVVSVGSQLYWLKSCNLDINEGLNMFEMIYDWLRHLDNHLLEYYFQSNKLKYFVDVFWWPSKITIRQHKMKMHKLDIKQKRREQKWKGKVKQMNMFSTDIFKRKVYVLNGYHWKIWLCS